MEISEVKRGMPVGWNGAVWVATDIQFVNPGKGSAFYKVKLKNVETDQQVEHTFKSGERLEDANMVQKPSQFLYTDGTTYHFMDTASYEQFEFTAETVGDAKRFLKDGDEVKLLTVNGRPIGVTLNPKMVFTVVEAGPGVKGDSASAKTMPVKIETGAMINVPLFVKQGDKIRVNTISGEYVERVN